MTRKHLLIILILFVVTRAALVGAGAVSLRFLESVEGDEYKHLLDGGPALDMWYRWDAGFYATIAIEGYDWLETRLPSADMAFLPVYPLLTRLASGISGAGCVWSPYLSTCATVGGLIVSNLALLGSCFLLYMLAHRRFGASVALRSVILLLISPAAIFLAGVYTESLFLFWVLLCFWLLDRNQFMLAIFAACLACLTRSVGVALVPALLWWVWQQHRGMTLRIRAVLALLPGAVFAAYVLGAGLVVGEPLAFFSAYEGIWGRSSSILDSILIYTREPVALFGWYPSWLDLIAAAAYLALGAWITWKWREKAWGIYALFATLIPIASGSLVGMPRFGGVIFPFYVQIARWLDRPWKQAVVYAISAGLALLFLSRFVTWRWIA
ncbi:MAG: glycosyltransferase family 39 protein [Anaerolineae bacterium]|nr:glycosyltransferase family 39 protein [Anaerolineae bacterium]